MVLEDRKESRLITNVSDILIVQEVETLNKSGWTTECGYQSCLIVRHEADDQKSVNGGEINQGLILQRVFPNRTFECLGTSVLQRADTIRVCVDVAAL